MYSYEDRIRAVEPYIKLGKRVRATLRPVGQISTEFNSFFKIGALWAIDSYGRPNQT